MTLIRTNLTIIEIMLVNDIAAGRVEKSIPLGIYAVAQYAEYSLHIDILKLHGIPLPDSIAVVLPYEQWLEQEVTEDDVQALYEAAELFRKVVDSGNGMSIH